MARPVPIALLAGAVMLTGCAAPQTQMGSVSQDQIVIEQARQQQFVVQNDLKQQFRVLNAANPLLRAAAPLCGENVRPSSGFVLGNAYMWQKEFFFAALALGYNDTLVVMNVTPGMAAAAAGVLTGDRIIAFDGISLLTGKPALEDFASRLGGPKQRDPKPYTLAYRRGAATATVKIEPEQSCAYSIEVVKKGEVQAYADGRSIVVYTGMLQFLQDDDELAVVLSHEIAHNAMHHMDAQKKNSLIGGLVGLVADVAAAAAGVNTQGGFTKQGMEAGAMVFSQDFEREADYVGLYLLALADKPLGNAPNLWRRMATLSSKSIVFASTHPTTAERFVRLEQWREEIARKVASGAPLAPEMRKGASALANRIGAGTRPRVTAATVPKGTSAEPSTVAVAGMIDRSRSVNSPSGPTKSEAGRPIPKSQQRSSSESVHERVASETLSEPSDLRGQAIIGAPSSESARVAAVQAFAEGNAYVDSHQWGKAEQSFRQTLLLDGSQAEYHAALGSVLMVQQRWIEAQAAYSAAVLLDLDNQKYRRRLKEARSRH